MGPSRVIVVLAVSAACILGATASALELEQQDQSVAVAAQAVNPIRRVVTMLQGMQKTVAQEGEKAKELFDKFMCYCKTSGSGLQDAIAAAEDKLSTLPTTIEEAKEKLKASKEDLKTAQTDRSAAKTAMAEATGMREKEAAAFSTAKAEYDANIGAMTKAIAALEKGMGGSFLQSDSAQLLRHIVANNQDLGDEDRETLGAFLSVKDGSDYAPQSGAITGILKTMLDEMTKALTEATAAEESAIKDYDGLMAAKTKEVDACTVAIEKKTKQIGDLGVEIVQLEADLDDTEQAYIEDKKFLKDLDKSCSTKSAEFDADMKLRSQELTAIADTIKILNDDDALELFKKTLPAPSSFVQVKVSDSRVRGLAQAAVRKALEASDKPERWHLDLISLALHARKIDFSKVIKMIDDMVALLKKEQQDDIDKKQYCEKSLDLADDKQKALTKGIKDADAAMGKATKAIETLTEEIAALEAGIKKLDKEVAEATEQRKDENEEYKALIASDTASKELLLFAKNRLNKFYNPKLYKPPPKQELSSEGRIEASFSFSQVRVHGVEAPPPPPPTASYSKKSEESTGVIAMIDLLVAEMDKEIAQAEAEEKNAQSDYESMVSDSAAKRAADSKSIAEKEGVRADMEAELETQKGVKKDTSKELYATLKYIDTLHGECDFLLQYFDVRKEARTSEIQSLTDAKAVLSGADFSLLQTAKNGFLGRRE